MKPEILHKWVPDPNIPSKLWYMISLVDKNGLLCIEISDDKDISSWSFTFKSYLSYRNTDEGDRLKFLSELKGQQPWSLYLVENSKYIKWFDEESCSKWDPKSIFHYTFFTQDDLIDVLALEIPIAKKIR